LRVNSSRDEDPLPAGEDNGDAVPQWEKRDMSVARRPHFRRKRKTTPLRMKIREGEGPHSSCLEGLLEWNSLQNIITQKGGGPCRKKEVLTKLQGPVEGEKRVLVFLTSLTEGRREREVPRKRRKIEVPTVE